MEPFYLPIIAGPFSPKMPTNWISECAMSALTFENVVKDIASGQLEDVLDVVCVDPAARFSQVVTKSVAIAVAEFYVNKYQDKFPLWLRRWLISHDVDVEMFE